MDYTVYIPKEFFFGELSNIPILIVGIIILIIIVFFGYKYFAFSKKRRRPEYF